MTLRGLLALQVVCALLAWIALLIAAWLREKPSPLQSTFVHTCIPEEKPSQETFFGTVLKLLGDSPRQPSRPRGGLRSHAVESP